MAIVVIILGLLIAGIGLVGVVRPAALLGLVAAVWRTNTGLYLAVGFRLVFGVLLLLAGPSCRFPLTIQILGGVSIAGALALPIFGRERIWRITRWWMSRSHVFIRTWSLGAAAFGVFLVYAGA